MIDDRDALAVLLSEAYDSDVFVEGPVKAEASVEKLRRLTKLKTRIRSNRLVSGCDAFAHYEFGIVTSGVAQLSVEGRPASGPMAVLSHEVSIRGGPFTWTSLLVPRDMIAHELSLLAQADIDGGDLPRFDSDLRRCAGLFRGLYRHTRATETWERAAVSLLLESLPHSQTARIEELHAAAGPGRVARAMEYLRANRHRPYSLAEVCEAVGCKRTAIHTAFHRKLGIPPRAFHRDCRLDGFREDLQRTPAALEWWKVAARWGFEQRNRAVRWYSDRFGEAPWQTKRLTE